MAKRAIRVAAGEMELLSMLWSSGPLTLRQAFERFLEGGGNVSYPTMQTRLNRLVEKGLVAKSSDYPASYQAVATRDQVTAGHLRQLIDKLSRGDIVPLVASLLTDQPLMADQIAELQQLLADAQKKSQTASKRRKS